MQETISTASGSCVIGGTTSVSAKEQSQKTYISKVKEQEGYYKNLIISCLAFSVFGLAAFSFYQNSKIEQLNMVNTINQSGSKLNDDNFREVLFTMLHELRNNTVENSKNIGKVEGILAVATNQKPSANDYTKIWHDGYYRGMNQIEDVGAAEYIRGYHAACDDLNCPEGAKEKAQNGVGKRNGLIQDNIPEKLTENK